VLGAFVALILALASSACTTTGQPPTASMTVRGPTIAFESVDGPPESIFHRLVQTISDEAETQQVAVVSRAEAAQFRIRSYVSAQTLGKRSTVAWVWDIYDADQRRALRISGEEPANPSGTGTWAVADDQVLRRIAHNGMERLVAFLQNPPAAPRPQAPAPAIGPDERTAAVSGDNPRPTFTGFRTAAADTNR
jgi:hypothetical protein